MFMIMGIFSFIIFGGTVIYFFSSISNVTTNAQQELERGEMSERRDQPVSPSKDNISILFLGVDDREGDLSGRTDAMILATFNKELGTVKLLNIPRDSLVDIPGRRNQDKINHAHAFGGVDLAVETVEELFDIPVDYYSKLNFYAFVEIVDALGGIDVNVPFTFTEMDSSDQHDAITLQEGLQTLNGEEALAFARMRKSDPRGDLGRGERQQEIIKAVITKGASLSSITSYGDVLKSIEDHLSMNLTFGNLLALHSYSSALNDIESLTLEGSDTRINGTYYYQLDPESVRELSVTFQVHLGLIKPEASQDSEIESEIN
ncbi:LCP family glycopolymer transferase [Halalkalibacter nanhaiisediminis]|uniref:LytR family transcriptional attenuator n=1 Tax=Halalkalibacter nanhaiisediminis TaxID=688079 RepID=A0A562QT83_9BACI|nr:LCP family protein [Halalkalibacter nanhaiisediminis]TWI59935.1 LytR family transcriptional attenuator [Halalkalibacter nanhaiisediminis]